MPKQAQNSDPGCSPRQSLAEFTAQFSRHQRHAFRSVLAICVGLILLFLILILTIRLAPASWQKFATVTVGTVAVAANVTMIILLCRASPRAVLCNHCGSTLGHDAIALQRCPKCLIELFDSTLAIPSTSEWSECFGDLTREGLTKVRPPNNYWPLIAWAGVGILLSGVVAVIFRTAKPSLEATWGDAAQRFFPIAVQLPALVLVNVGVLMTMRRRNRLLPQCPACSHPLSASQVFLVTGHCPGCGERILQDPLAPERLAAGMSIELLDRKAFMERQAQSRRFAVVAMLVTGAIAMSSLLFVRQFAIWLGLSVSRNEESALYIAMLFFPAVVLFSVIVWIQLRLNHWNACPHCKKSLFGMTSVVQSTGNCCRCGYHILAE